MWCSSARLDELLDEKLEEQLKDQLGDQLEVQLDDEDNLQRRKVFSRGLGELTRKILYLTHVLVMLRGRITEDLS